MYAAVYNTNSDSESNIYLQNCTTDQFKGTIDVKKGKAVSGGGGGQLLQPRTKAHSSGNSNLLCPSSLLSERISHFAVGPLALLLLF